MYRFFRYRNKSNKSTIDYPFGKPWIMKAFSIDNHISGPQIERTYKNIVEKRETNSNRWNLHTYMNDSQPMKLTYPFS